MGLFGDIKNKFSQDTYEDSGYMYDDADEGANLYEEPAETDFGTQDNAATIGGSGYDIMGGGSAIELKVVKPHNYDDGPAIAGYLMDGYTVVMNIEELERSAAMRLIDFLLGALEVLNGEFRRVTKTTLVLSPRSGEVAGEDEEEEY